MLGGDPIPPLLSVSRHKAQLDGIERITRSKIYRGERRAETMLIASRTIDMLLDGIAGMLFRREATAKDGELTLRDQAVLDLLNRSRDPAHPFPRDRAGWVREMMDTIASLTDHAAIRMAKIVAGGFGA
jgi:dGTP triphosphohydrolase